MSLANSDRLQSIPTFCVDNNISQSFFYKLQAQGKAPKVIKIGTRSIITPEARQAWRDSLNKQSIVRAAFDSEHFSDPTKKIKTTSCKQGFAIVKPAKNGRENTVFLTPEEAIDVTGRLEQARQEWQW